jgi:hypothetical protein
VLELDRQCLICFLPRFSQLWTGRLRVGPEVIHQPIEYLLSDVSERHDLEVGIELDVARTGRYQVARTLVGRSGSLQNGAERGGPGGGRACNAKHTEGADSEKAAPEYLSAGKQWGQCEW